MCYTAGSIGKATRSNALNGACWSTEGDGLDTGVVRLFGNLAGHEGYQTVRSHPASPKVPL